MSPSLRRRIGLLLASFAQVVLDAVAAILGTYYSKKYAAITRRLGLPRVPSTDRRGFIIIQIDGLSYTHLNTAMRWGYAPYMRRMLRRGEFRLHRWFSGLPSTTPSAQAGIMFGNNDDIPAFRWYDKKRGELIVCKTPGTLKMLQDRVSQGRRGILAGGSSIMNMFDGDASLSMFTLGAWNTKRFFESVRGVGFALLFALNPFRTIKTLVLAVWEYLTDLALRTWTLLRGETPRPLEPAFPLLRVLSNVVLREIQTFAVMVDIYRGVPAIYTTYYGYDELAHNYGPLSKPALRALHAIDARIGQIDALRRLALTREYDLFVLSDHGITAARPFHHTYGQTLGELIRDLVGGNVRLSESRITDPPGALRATYLLDELATIESNVKSPLRLVVRKLRSLVARRIALGSEADPAWDLSRRTELVIRNSGSMSHVYFNVSDKPLNLSEITALYPTLIHDLLAHPGIWLVVGREGDQVVAMSEDGVLTLDGGHHVEGHNPLARLAMPSHTAAAQLWRLAHFPHAGDLILMGQYDPNQQTVVCFEDQWACHGGLGGPQGVAFMIADHSIDWHLDRIEQATELYPLFRRRYAT